MQSCLGSSSEAVAKAVANTSSSGGNAQAKADAAVSPVDTLHRCCTVVLSAKVIGPVITKVKLRLQIKHQVGSHKATKFENV